MKPHVIPDTDGIDLDFRPHSYWADADPVSAITQNSKGQRRREIARRQLTDPNNTDGVDALFTDDTLSDDERIAAGRVHPSFMGGEYLPNYAQGEVEIARIVLESVTQDVYSIRVRRTKSGRLRYAMHDEYESVFALSPTTSRQPLILRQLITLIDTAQSEQVDTMGLDFVEGHIAWQLDGGVTDDEARGFISVESVVYPELARHYERRANRFVDEHGRGNDEDEDSEE